MHNLAPVALEHDGLPEALKKTVADWARRTGVRADFTLTGTAEHLHEEISATLLRIAQEALSNASRHARAARLGVTLSFMGDEVTLDVRDDGRGFDPAAVPGRTGNGGFGLDGMRARAERVAGSSPWSPNPAAVRRSRRAYRWSAMTDDAVITLLIVDDHPVVRDGLRGMFESAPGFTVLGEAANGVEAVALTASSTRTSS